MFRSDSRRLWQQVAGIRRRVPPVQEQFRGAGAFPAQFPVLVRRRRLCGHRDRRSGTGSHHVFTRNVYREFFHPRATDKQEAQMAKWVSLIVKFGALSFIVFVPLQYAIQLQLLGGVWIIQTLPTVLIGLTGDGSTRGRC